PGNLTVVGNTIYGVAANGGQFGKGTLFSMNLDGSHFQVLHSFAGGPNDGARPSLRGLTFSGNTLYGVTESGGTLRAGTVFAPVVREPAAIVPGLCALAGLLVAASRRLRRMR